MGTVPRLELQKAVEQTAARGRLVYDVEVAERFFGGLPGIARKERWVRQHLPRDSRIKIGRSSAWYETDIQAWIESRRRCVSRLAG
jgi:hypothetical protein